MSLLHRAEWVWDSSREVGKTVDDFGFGKPIFFINNWGILNGDRSFSGVKDVNYLILLLVSIDYVIS